MQASIRQTVGTADFAELYASVRSYTEKLCEPLEIEDYIPQPIVDVSPPKWNIAHTTWFFEEMILKKFVPRYEVFDPQFGFLFNSYYNSIGERTLRGAVRVHTCDHAQNHRPPRRRGLTTSPARERRRWRRRCRPR